MLFFPHRCLRSIRCTQDSRLSVMKIKLNKRNNVTVDMSKQRGVLNHIHNEISKSICHIWIHFAGTVWPPSASNIRRGVANARDSSGSLCLESSAHFFSGVSFDLLMSQEEPTQLAMMCYRDEGLSRPPSKNPGLPNAILSGLSPDTRAGFQPDQTLMMW